MRFCSVLTFSPCDNLRQYSNGVSCLYVLIKCLPLPYEAYRSLDFQPSVKFIYNARILHAEAMVPLSNDTVIQDPIYLMSENF